MWSAYPLSHLQLLPTTIHPLQMTKNEIQMIKTYELEKAMRSIVDSRATHSNSTTNNMSSWGQMNHEIIKKNNQRDKWTNSLQL